MGLEDREYVAASTNGFEELRAHALKPENSPESVAKATGIDAGRDCAAGAGLCCGGT